MGQPRVVGKADPRRFSGGAQLDHDPQKTRQLSGCLRGGIIRHRGKIEATITNARAWQKIEQRQGFDTFMWDYVGGAPLQNTFETQADVPPKTALSEQVSKDLKKAGFKFCGPTIVYAWMEACGLVNDHLVGCHRHAACAAMQRP